MTQHPVKDRTAIIFRYLQRTADFQHKVAASATMWPRHAMPEDVLLQAAAGSHSFVDYVRRREAAAVSFHLASCHSRCCSRVLMVTSVIHGPGTNVAGLGTRRGGLRAAGACCAAPKGVGRNLSMLAFAFRAPFPFHGRVERRNQRSTVLRSTTLRGVQASSVRHRRRLLQPATSAMRRTNFPRHAAHCKKFGMAQEFVGLLETPC